MCGYEEERHRNGGPSAVGGGGGSAGGAAWSDDESPVPVTSKDPFWGKRDAPVTIVVFSDFECPYCAKVAPTFEQLRTTYGPDKLRIVWKNQPLPFHSHARPTAEAAQGVFALAGSDAFWRFHDAAFKNNTALTSDNFEKWAREAGVTGADLPKLRAGLAAHTWSEKVDRDMSIAKTAGISSTPSFVVNGVPLIGAQPFDKFKTLVDLELAKAQAKIAAGTARDRVYVVMSQDNKKSAPQAPADDEPKEDTKTVWKVPVSQSPALGDSGALVTVVAFLDFECPYCKQGDALLRKIRETNGDKVRLVFKNQVLPFHSRALPAAELAMEALAEKGAGGFWEAERRIFDSAPKLDDAALDAIATSMGLDLRKVQDARKSHPFSKAIDADADVADDFQATSTPTFFINGRRVVGAQPIDRIQKIIDEEIGRAGDLLSRGTSRAALYDTLVQSGKAPPEPEKKALVIPPSAPTRGNPNARVVIQQVSDYECPYCGKAEDVVRDVMKAYGDRVKLVWRDFPLSFHAHASLAAQAAREAFTQKGTDAFWKMHDKLFTNQKDLSRETLDGYARELGLDMNRFRIALDLGTHKALVDAEAKAMSDAGMNGTPAFLVNGAVVPGGANPAKMRKMIERALVEAK